MTAIDVRSPRAAQRRSETGASHALRTSIGVFGVLVGAAGVEHGVGEILQGRVPPAGLMIESWAGTEAFDVLAGEPAMTVLPDLLLAGVATVVAGSALAAWSWWFIDRRSGPLVLLVLSLVLLLVGGGLAPPVMGVIAAVAATRINAPSRRPPGRILQTMSRQWVWLVGGAVVGYLSLVPGLVVVAAFGVTPPDGLIYGIAGASYLGLVLGLIAARARDRRAALHVTPRTR